MLFAEVETSDPEIEGIGTEPLGGLNVCNGELLYVCVASIALGILGFTAAEFWKEVDDEGMALEEEVEEEEEFCILRIGRLETASARLTNENLSLNSPSVRTDKSWKINQIPKLSSKSCNLYAVATREPIKFLVGGVVAIAEEFVPEETIEELFVEEG